MPRRGRRLTPEEVALWNRVAARTTKAPPADGARRGKEPGPPAPPEVGAPRAPIGVDRPARNAVKYDLAPGIAAELRAAPLSMDAKTNRRMRRGSLAPEAKIDLHGMTRAAAHAALAAFIGDAAARGLRLVLVVTGKGRRAAGGGPIPEEAGALRREVPIWLRAPHLAGHVLQVDIAHRRHGGSGAYYVYLRRRR